MVPKSSHTREDDVLYLWGGGRAATRPKTIMSSRRSITPEPPLSHFFDKRGRANRHRLSPTYWCFVTVRMSETQAISVGDAEEVRRGQGEATEAVRPSMRFSSCISPALSRKASYEFHFSMASRVSNNVRHSPRLLCPHEQQDRPSLLGHPLIYDQPVYELSVQAILPHPMGSP